MIRVFIAEDHKILRDGLASLLREDPEIEISGEASNGRELLEKIPNHPTDVAIMDVNMPEMDGLETMKQIKFKHPGLKVIVLTMLDHENYVSQFFECGAKGYALKNISKEELLETVKKIHGGDTYLSPEIANNMIQKLREPESISRSGNLLSKREIEVLHLVAEGMTNHEIAGRLLTSRRTIESHRKNLIEKTGVKNTAALIKYAFTNGLIK